MYGKIRIINIYSYSFISFKTKIHTITITQPKKSPCVRRDIILVSHKRIIRFFSQIIKFKRPILYLKNWKYIYSKFKKLILQLVFKPTYCLLILKEHILLKVLLFLKLYYKIIKAVLLWFSIYALYLLVF